MLGSGSSGCISRSPLDVRKPDLSRIPRRSRVRETREHVAYVAREIPPDPRAGAREPPDDRTRRVEAARDPLCPCLELRRRHEGGLEDGVFLAVVLRPVCRADPAFGGQATEGRSPGHGYDHAHRRDVDARLVEELGGAAEDPDVILGEAENDPEVDGNPVAVQKGDEPAVVTDAVVRLVRRLEAVLRDRFETPEQLPAA